MSFVEQHADVQKQPVRGVLKLFPKFQKTVFNKDHFIVNLVYQISIKKGKITWNISYVIYFSDDL